MYVVETFYTDHNEWSDEIEEYCDALNYARKMSELDGVSETRVWDEDEIMAVFVDGEEEEELTLSDEWDEPYDPFDEVGYDPYGGCFDMDL